MSSALLRTGRFLLGHPLARTRKLRTLGRFARWQVESRLRSEVQVRWIGGTRLSVRRGMTGATGNVYVGLHEFPDMAFVLHLLRPGDLFLDVGANVGSYTVLASGVCGADTVAFEPDPDAARAFACNVALNRLEHLVTLREAAAGAETGPASLTRARGPANRLVAGDGGPVRRVRVETVDGALGRRMPMLVKMDVEGHEPEVLKGAAAALASPDLRAVLSENASPPVAETLEAAGFQRAGYDPLARRLVPPGRSDCTNALFVRDRAFVDCRLAAAPGVDVLGTMF